VSSLNDIYFHANCTEGIIKAVTDIVLLTISVKFHRSQHTVYEWTLVYLSTLDRPSNPTVTVAASVRGLMPNIKVRGNSRFIGAGTDCYCTEELGF
jgi:hypothetical protein